MPDPTKRTVSASQCAALFNQHQYYTRWMLWHYFKNDLSLEPNISERINWGRLLQDDILEMTGRAYKLEVAQNVSDEYRTRGPLGATIDGLMVAPDKGPVIIEAKNIDWLRWRDTWSEESATLGIEIQTQIGMHCAGADHGIIAALIGGNDLRFYEREINKELVLRVRDEASDFLHSVERGIEPDPLGSPLELPMVKLLYPNTDPIEILEDYGDDQLAMTLRQLHAAQFERKFNEKLENQMKAALLARAGTARIVRANGFQAVIRRWDVAPGVCQPHTEPKVIRQGSVTVAVAVEPIATEFVRDVLIDGIDDHA